MKRDTLIAATLEAGLLTLSAVLAYVFQAPLVFSSLGPTAYELVEMPERPSARPYSVLVGHGVAIVAGLLAVFLTHATHAPAMSVGRVALPRAFAVVLAAFFTVVGTLTLKANQPAALSTTLLVAVGTMDTRKAVFSIVVSVVLITLVGTPVRRYRLRSLHREQATK